MSYKERYGDYGGNPKGHAPDFTRCCEDVARPLGVTYMYGQCTRKRGYGPEGAYCKQHDPIEVAKRNKAASDKWESQALKERFRYFGKTFHDALEEIAKGHNDPRAKAVDVLAKFDPKAWPDD